MTEHQAIQYQIPNTPQREVIATYDLAGEQTGEEAVRAALGEALGHAVASQPFEQSAIDQGRRESSSVPFGAATISPMQYEPAPILPPSNSRLDFEPTNTSSLLRLSKYVIEMRAAARSERAA